MTPRRTKTQPKASPAPMRVLSDDDDKGKPTATQTAVVATLRPAFGYIRVSTEEQKDNYSPEYQRTTIETYAARSGFTITRWFFDDVSGAIPLDARPEGRAMLLALRTQEANVVICLVPDRLARDTIHALILRKLWQKQGIEMHFATRGKVGDTISDQVLYTVDFIMAEVERERIRDRTRNGRITKITGGNWLGIQQPFGYQRTGQQRTSALVIDPEESRWVRQMFEWYVYGDAESGGPLGLREISRRLNAAGVVPPRLKRGKVSRNQKRPHEWAIATISQILKYELYYGEYMYGKTVLGPRERDDQKDWQRAVALPEEQWLRVPFPELAFIDREIWDAAQRRLKANSEMTKWRRTTVYLLSGFMRCKSCGHSLSGWRNYLKQQDKTNYYYVCPNKDCLIYHRSVRCDQLDPVIWQKLIEELEPGRVKQQLDALRLRRQEGTHFQRERLEELGKMEESELSRLARLSDRYGRETDELIR